MSRQILRYDDLPHSAEGISLASPSTSTQPHATTTDGKRKLDHLGGNGNGRSSPARPKKKNKTRAEKRAARERGMIDGSWPGQSTSSATATASSHRNGSTCNNDDDDDGEDAEEEWEVSPSFVIPTPFDQDGLDYQDDADGDDEQVHDAWYDVDGQSHVDETEVGRTLTHAEIWGDTSLVAAWEAASTEYIFLHTTHPLTAADLEQRKGKSALWWSSPSATGKLASEAKKLASRWREERRDMAMSKRAFEKQKSTVLHRSTPMQKQGGREESNEIGEKKADDRKEERENAAWRKACRIVEATSNQIGATPSPSALQPPTTASIAATGRTDTPSLPTATLPHPHSELFQNVTMAWYYAGYYTGLYNAAHQQTQAQQTKGTAREDETKESEQ